MLLALSVLGGLAVPNNPDAPSYTAGAWGRYFPVQKVYSPRQEVNIALVASADPFQSGDLAELSVEDCRRIYGDVSTYINMFEYRGDKGTSRWAQLRLAFEGSREPKFIAIANYNSGKFNTSSSIELFPVTTVAKAANGTLKVLSSSVTYGGALAGTTAQSMIRVAAGVSIDFYYHHAAKGLWRLDAIALKTVDNHTAVIDLATQQFIALT